jgi:hypothetical protein
MHRMSKPFEVLPDTLLGTHNFREPIRIDVAVELYDNEVGFLYKRDSESRFQCGTFPHLPAEVMEVFRYDSSE